MRVYLRKKKWYYDINVHGKRERGVIQEARTKGDAEAYLAKRKLDLLNEKIGVKTEKKITFEAMRKEFLDHAKLNTRSEWRYRASLDKLGEFFNGKRLIGNITEKEIEEYKKKRLEEVKEPTVNRDLAALKRMFTIAIKRKYVKENPVKGIKYFREKPYQYKVLNPEEFTNFLDASKDELKGMLRVFIIIKVNTGMRRTEVLTLKWTDIDFEKFYIHLKNTKSGKERIVPMNHEIRKCLNGLDRTSIYVFPNYKGEPKLEIYQPFMRVCKKVGIRLRPHDLRHTAATWMIQSGIDLASVKEILGHATIEMTMRYAHPTPERKREAVDALARLFKTEDPKKHGTKVTHDESIFRGEYKDL